MAEEQTAYIEAVRTWLRECPHIDANDRFNVNYLGDGGKAGSEFTIEDVPTVPVIKQYLKGAVKQKNYIIASREAYGIDILQNIANSGLYDNLSAWVRQQCLKKNFPDFGTGIQIRNVQTTSTAYIFEAGAKTARYQIPLQITFFDKEDIT